jgi:hypothetical protein
MLPNRIHQTTLHLNNAFHVLRDEFADHSSSVSAYSGSSSVKPVTRLRGSKEYQDLFKNLLEYARLTQE